MFRYQFSQKSPRVLHVLNHGWWQLATGGWWRLVVVGGGWWLAVGGWRRLAVVGSWRLVAAGGWRRLVVGGWWRLAVDGSWRLAVGGPLGRSLRAVLSKKKKIWSLEDPPAPYAFPVVYTTREKNPRQRLRCPCCLICHAHHQGLPIRAGRRTLAPPPPPPGTAAAAGASYGAAHVIPMAKPPLATGCPPPPPPSRSKSRRNTLFCSDEGCCSRKGGWGHTHSSVGSTGRAHVQRGGCHTSELTMVLG